jgi:MFS family permease
MTSTKTQGFRSNFELFKTRDFAILWAGFTFSGLGDSIYYIARIALIIKLTGSALAAGGMTVFGILPTVLMSLTGGALADRLDRQKLVVWSNFARGLIMLVLA